MKNVSHAFFSLFLLLSTPPHNNKQNKKQKKPKAYIPLDREMQLKGKAAIDVVCNPLGKSGGSAIQQVLIIAFGSLATSTPYLAVVLLGIVLLWLKAAASLDKQFAALQEEQQLTKLAEARDVAAPGASKKFKWVSSISSQTGLMEGGYVPLGDGESVTASMDVVEAASAEEAAAKRKSAERGRERGREGEREGVLRGEREEVEGSA